MDKGAPIYMINNGNQTFGGEHRTEYTGGEL